MFSNQFSTFNKILSSKTKLILFLSIILIVIGGYAYYRLTNGTDLTTKLELVKLKELFVVIMLILVALLLLTSGFKHTLKQIFANLLTISLVVIFFYFIKPYSITVDASGILLGLFFTNISIYLTLNRVSWFLSLMPFIFIILFKILIAKFDNSLDQFVNNFILTTLMGIVSTFPTLLLFNFKEIIFPKNFKLEIVVKLKSQLTLAQDKFKELIYRFYKLLFSNTVNIISTIVIVLSVTLLVMFVSLLTFLNLPKSFLPQVNESSVIELEISFNEQTTEEIKSLIIKDLKNDLNDIFQEFEIVEENENSILLKSDIAVNNPFVENLNANFGTYESAKLNFKLQNPFRDLENNKIKIFKSFSKLSIIFGIILFSFLLLVFNSFIKSFVVIIISLLSATPGMLFGNIITSNPLTSTSVLGLMFSLIITLYSFIIFYTKVQENLNYKYLKVDEAIARVLKEYYKLFLIIFLIPLILNLIMINREVLFYDLSLSIISTTFFSIFFFFLAAPISAFLVENFFKLLRTRFTIKIS